MTLYTVYLFDKLGNLKRKHVHFILRFAEHRGLEWQRKKKGNYYEVAPFEVNI